MISYLLILLSFSSIASGVSKKNESKKLADELANIRNKTTTLVAQIRSIEKDLGAKNNRYLSEVQKYRSLQAKAGKISEDLKSNMMLINDQEQVYSKIRRYMVLEAIDEDDENAFTNFVTLKEAMSLKNKELLNLKSKNKNISELFSSIEKKLQETSEKEESLQSLILELEEKKSKLSQDYISTVEEQNTKQEEFDRLKIELRAKKKVYKAKVVRNKDEVNLKVISPLATFSSYKEKDRVITFQYDRVEPVRAVASGKVEYAKELSSYGKVIIIDHGNQVRSIVLGDLSVKTQKGLLVKQGELIGYTKADPGMKKSLHFELRKNNKVQSALQALNFKGTNSKKI
jgi:murein DD-endopeptidase MepM/ murein hydrolase activator NlpD